MRAERIDNAQRRGGGAMTILAIENDRQTPAGVVLDFDDPDGNRLQAFEAGSQIA